MKRSNRKYLSALVLSLAMILSLCSATIMPQKEAKAAIELSNPTTDSDGVRTWDCIYFGNYPQSEYIPKQAPANPVSDTEYIDSDGTKMVYREWEKEEWNDEKDDPDTVSCRGYFKVEPIKWRVLSVDENDAFLLADQNLDAKAYNEEYTSVTWMDCTLRTWLNGTFLQTAFTSAEQAAIKSTTVVNDDNPSYGTEGGNNTTDQVYLLSIAEASNTAYGFDGKSDTTSKARVATNTAYTVSQNYYVNSAGSADYWWLRSPGNEGGSIAFVNRYGCVNYEGINVACDSYAVRPALHLNLSSSTLWNYAEKVSANGGGGKSATPTATSAPDQSAGNNNDVVPTPTVVPVATPMSGTSTSAGSVTSVPPTDSAKATVPAKVTLKSVKNKKGKKAVAKWKKVSGADGYQIQYALKKSFKGKKSVTTSKTSYTLKKLKKKKTYYIRVCAYKLNGKKKVYGKWSATKKVKIKK